MAVINELKYAAMTATIDKIKTPNRFIVDMLYTQHSPQSTEEIHIETWVRGRRMAPFVRVNAESVPVSGTTQSRAVVEAPNIRIRRDLKPHEFMFNRTPGNVIFASQSSQRAAIREHIAKELLPLKQDVDNRMEWMACQTLNGTLTYDPGANNYQGDAFTIDYQRPASHDENQSGGGLWSAPTSSDVLQDILDAQRVGSEEGFVYTDMIMNSVTADLFWGCVKADTGPNKFIKEFMKTDSNINTGVLSLTNQYNDQGVLFHGSLKGVNIWEYNRSVLDYDDGSSAIKLIPDNEVYFVSRGPQADFVMYYGAIPDWDALEGRAWVGENFTKSEIKKDPSTFKAITHSRPLPVPRRPEATYTLTVA
jgi:hypothetical protein